MPTPKRRTVLVATLFSAIGAGRPGLARAQSAGPRIRGRILRFDGEVLAIAARDGGEVAVKLEAAVPIAALRRLTLADLVPGTQLGVVAEPAGEGLRAVAINVLPPTATRQFQAPWDLTPGSTMNNGPVAALVSRAEAHELTLSINGRDVPMRVDAATTISQPVPATRGDLVPGAAVQVGTLRAADGTLLAQRVVVERDGVAPAG